MGDRYGVLGVIFLRDWFVCFLFGHLAAVVSETFQSIWWRPWIRRGLSGACLALGLLMCLFAAAYLVRPFAWLVAARLPLPSTNDPQDSERLYAAIFIFAGVFGLTKIHRPLEHPAFRWLGRMSFPIYLTHFPIMLSIIPLLFKHLPAWFWVPFPALVAINPQIEYPRAFIVAFLAAIVFTLAAATCFLAIDSFAISAGRKLRAYIASSQMIVE
jgi:peptidoglycan/LPS O-acetylase OafA/YrhL